MRKIILFFLLITAGLCASNAQNLPEAPNPPRLVVDLADMLNSEEEISLEKRLEVYEDSTSNEISVVTVENLDGDAVEDYANKLFEKWQIGKKGRDNGILILIAKETHDIRIEVGYGLEPKVPDLFAKQVEDEIMIPEFKKGNFSKGLNDGITILIKKAAGEFQGMPKKKGKGGSVWTLIIIIIIILFIISRFQGPYDNYTGGGRRGGYYGGGGFGGGGFGGGGGGGFGGFGGGGSGGGGASGRW